jgi:tetratricopeptide (TPR) repeat protein
MYGESSGGAEVPPRPYVSAGLRDVLARCLRQDPAARYPSAALVAEDLRRHLTDRPLAGVRNRSLAERWRKWRRRRPQALLLWLLAALCVAAVATFVFFNVNDSSQRRHVAEAALEQGQRQAEQRQYAEAIRTFDGALEGLGRDAAGTPLYAELRRHRRRAGRLHDIEALHEQVERSRYLQGDDLLSPQRLRALSDQCRDVWEQRVRLLAGGDEPPDANVEEMLRRDLLDVAVLWVDCQVRLAGPSEEEAARREGLRVLREAEALFGPSPVLSRERRALDPRASDDGPPPRTAWEHYTVGRSLLLAGELDGAAAAFDRAVESRPQDFWPWFGKGVCAHRRKHPDEAVTAFTVCVALAPDSAACYFNRAMALAARGDPAAALRDYDHALRLDPHLAAAALNRGALHLQERRYAEAESDFRLAMKLGANAAAVHYNRALLHQARQEPEAALECLGQALEIDPDHRPSRELQALLRAQIPASK